jgi:rod shape-determining protein MreC
VAALLALIQVEFAREGRTSPLSAGLSSATVYLELIASDATDAVRGGFGSLVGFPSLYQQNARLESENARLTRSNEALAEEVSQAPDLFAARDLQERVPAGIPATVVGYDPENALRIVQIDKGSLAHVARDDGVIAEEGAVGRIIEVSPLSSKVLLITDVTSKLPAVVQRGRWWALANGTASRVKLQYVSQDAHLRVGDPVVTGEGRSFHAGILIGRIASVEPQSAGALDQTAIVEPAVPFGRLHHVLVIPK